MSPRLLIVTRERTEDKKYGLGKSIAPIIQVLEQRGWEVNYFCQDSLTHQQNQRRTQRVAWLNQAPWLNQHENRKFFMAAFIERLDIGMRAAQQTKVSSYSAVHLHDPWLALGYVLGRFVYRAPPIQWGITEHGFGAYFKAVAWDGLNIGPRLGRICRILERYILKQAHWVCAPTQRALNQLVQDLNLDSVPKRWHAIPHAKPHLETLSQEAAREQLGWSNHNIYLLAVGRLAPLKQFDLIIRVFASLHDLYPSLRLCILGGGDQTPLRSLAQQLRVEEKLIFTATDQVEVFYAAANLYLSASLTESFGLANFEAVCAGLPALCSDVGGVSDALGQGAMLLPPEEQAFKMALEQILAHPDMQKMYSQKALEHAAQWPTVEDITDRYVQLYS